MNRKTQLYFLIFGDIFLILLATILGFATHGTLDSAGSRMFTTFIPLAAAWLAVAPFIGCYSPDTYANPRQLWKPFWSMVLAAPFAAFLRSLMLQGSPILPVFVVVLGGVAALGMLAWRVLFLWYIRRKAAVNG
jgi:hypothetical protein